MTRPLTAFHPLPSDAALLTRFRDDPGLWLPGARAVGAGRWELEVEGLGLRRPVEVTVGPAWSIGECWWRTLSWTPVGVPSDLLPLERGLPVLDAELGIVPRPGDRHGWSLALDGRSAPPAGRLGEALDAVAFGRVARRTLGRFLAEVADGLTGQVSRPPAARAS